MRDLTLGCSSANGSVSVVGIDNLCYQIHLAAGENSSVATVSRAIIKEWVDALNQSPLSTATEIGNLLKGKSCVDEVEYARADVIHTLARIILEIDSVRQLSVSERIRNEFQDWQAAGRVAKKTAFENAVNYIPSIDDTLSPPTKHIWHGLRVALYGVPASVRIYEVKSYAELMSEYGALDYLFDRVTEHAGIDDLNFDKCYNWAHNRANHGSIRAAWRWYKKFWLWKDAQLTRDDKSKLFGILEAALYEFRNDRGSNGPDGWASYDAWAVAARQMFADVDAAKLTAEGFDYYADFARKFVYSPTVANTTFKDHGADEKIAVGNFLAQERQTPHAVSWYLDPANRPVANNEPVPGMGAGVILNFMMKLRPSEFATYSPMLHHMYVATGLTKEAYEDKLTVERYESSKALQGQVLAKMHELHIGQTADSEAPADYLTVNEFAWWLSDEKNLNLIKEKVMNATTKKPDAKCAEDGKVSVVEALKTDADSMMSRLTAALLTKPFAILAGASGTGKSRMVKKLAYMTCRADMLRSATDETPGNYCMIAVKPNWHDSSELLGYRSAFGEREYVTTDFVKFVLKAHAFPNTPFFVCLDEMNLAPVEQYFAEYLSAIESVGKNKDGEWTGDPLIQRGEFENNVANLYPEYQLADEVAKAINEKGLFIPQNLFVVGTVNMDDTTNQFSRKVLDRAMTIMMNEVNFATLKGESYEKLTNALRIKNEEIEKFIDRKEFDGALLEGGGFEALLDDLRKALTGSPFEIGYRYAIETAIYREALKFVSGKAGETDEEKADLSKMAIDHTALMKVLPRITGTLTEREEVLTKLGTFFGALNPHTLSSVMLNRMKEIAEQNGNYISFWP